MDLYFIEIQRLIYTWYEITAALCRDDAISTFWNLQRQLTWKVSVSDGHKNILIL